jgi:ABC-type glycerol-3-phosphate transport system substrate-binding protein
MGEKLRYFQFGILILFGILAIIGVIVIASNRSDKDGTELKSVVVIWGPPLGDYSMNKFLDNQKKIDPFFEKVTYVEKNPNTLYGDLLEAIATGKSPDLVILTSSGLLPLKNKLAPISFETIPLATFRNEYIEGAEIFVLPDAIYALPLLVDPLVLYWNRDLYAAEGVVQVPRDWDTLVQLTPRFSTIIGGGDLVQSAIAFGEYDNVLHAKEILSTLYMQTGAKVVRQGGADNRFYSDLNDASEFGKKNSHALALQFYTSFSNPNRTVYSWNKTFDRSREAFAANKVAMYVGFISEQKILTEINPNLNFDATIMPQLKNAHFSATYGNFYAVGVLKASRNQEQALYVAQVLSGGAVTTGSTIAKKLSELSGLPSARKDVLATQDVTDPLSNTKLQSALMARTWLEPAPQSQVSDFFRQAISNVVSGKSDPEAGTNQITMDLDVLLGEYNK